MSRTVSYTHLDVYKRQVIKTIRRLQPKAVTAIMGDDVRWVGNEKGIGRETEWSATALPPVIYSRSEELRKGLDPLSMYVYSPLVEILISLYRIEVPYLPQFHCPSLQSAVK